MAATLVNISNWIGAGANHAQYVLSQSGKPKSSDLANDSSRGMTQLKGIETANWQLAASSVVSIPGDDGVLGQISFPGTELPSFEMTLSELPVAFINAIQGTSTVDVQTTYDFLALDPKDADDVDMFIMLSRKSLSTESGSEGSGYETVIFPLCTVSFQGTNYANQSPGAFNFTVTVNRVSQLPWGLDLGSSVTGKEQVSGFMFWSEQIPTFGVYKEDGVETSFTLSNTIASNSQLIGFDNVGATNALGLSTNDATFSVGSAGDILTVLYEKSV